MNDSDSERGWRTRQEAFSGEEDSDEPTYFKYSATLRIFGTIPGHDELTGRLGIEPTHSHRAGERRSQNSEPYKHDMWSYTAPVNKHEPLHVHIDTLWSTFRTRKEYLLQLKKKVNVDVFLGYRSNCDHAGLEVPHTSLAIFLELEVPFGVSIIVT